MTIDPLYGFLFLGAFSPGPNIIMVATSGARFGFRRTIPNIFGILLGVGIIAGLAGLGMGTLLNQFPVLKTAMRVVSVGWMLWLAWGLWHARPLGESDNDKPMGFIESVLFQWVNPKLWAISFAASSGYPSDRTPIEEAFRLSTALMEVNTLALTFWSLTGVALSYLLKHAFAWMIFTRTMAFSLVLVGVLLLVP
jgi:threonine/homoserine/homoserine lactone efflux protein